MNLLRKSLSFCSEGICYQVSSRRQNILPQDYVEIFSASLPFVVLSQTVCPHYPEVVIAKAKKKKNANLNLKLSNPYCGRVLHVQGCNQRTALQHSEQFWPHLDVTETLCT